MQQDVELVLVWLLLWLKVRWCLVPLLLKLVTRVCVGYGGVQPSLGGRCGAAVLVLLDKGECFLNTLLFPFAFLIVGYLGGIQKLGLGSGVGSDLGRALADLHIGAHVLNVKKV